MALEIKKGHLGKAGEMYARLKEKFARYEEKANQSMRHVVQTSQVGIAAFAVGAARGRFGEITVIGVPVDLLAGVGLHVLGFVGGGRYEEAAHNFGDGALAGYLTTLGASIGAKWNRPKTSTDGEFLSGATAAPALGMGSPARGYGLSNQQILASLAATLKGLEENKKLG